MVRFEKVTKIYHDTEKDTVAVHDVDFYMEPGQMCFLTGESGSGKTTLLRMLMREIEPDQGSIYVNGIDITKMRHGELPAYRRKLGMIFQDYKLLPDRTAYQNVAMAKMITGAGEKEIRQQVAMALRMVELEDKYDRYPSQLSGGEQQRVGIARAIVNHSNLLLADEPTGNLDPTHARSIMLLLERINQMLGTTILIATHDMEAIRNMNYMHFTIDRGLLT